MISIFSLFFFNATATTEIYTLSLHDALPICEHFQRAIGTHQRLGVRRERERNLAAFRFADPVGLHRLRSEEHTSELQSQSNLVCRLLLEKKKKKQIHSHPSSSR